MLIRKPTIEDIEIIDKILTQWTELEEVNKYVERIKKETEGIIEYNTMFWLCEMDDKVVAIGGISDPLPKVMNFSKKTKPGEIKIIYVDNDYRGKGVGSFLLNSLENELKTRSYDEILVRSAERYKDTAYGFYEKMGYERVGTLEDQNMAVFYKTL